MTPEEINLIKTGHNQIKNTDYVDLFYKRLFEISPSSASLFSDNMDIQKIKLKNTLAVFVKGLAQPEKLKQLLFDLGDRHVDYGVHPDDFPDVEDALIQTLEVFIPEFCEAQENAWRNAIHFASENMLKAWGEVPIEPNEH